ncbi:hypothetical protein [Terricaulis sp.]|uniref:hypothetical protein n=1 Tax=Terricaulis sp. TaxID=2768686 RepID=UPI003784A988
MRLLFVTLIASVALTGHAFAQQQQAPPNCSASEHRALDFWIGQWDAYRADNNVLAGHSSITSADAGCVIHEQWESVGQNAGYAGQSLNIYNRVTGHWEQFWNDTTGTVTHYIGGPIAGGAVQMTTADEGPNAPARYNRVTFTPQSDGTVLQRGETSSDGQTWTLGYLLVYRRRNG